MTDAAMQEHRAEQTRGSEFGKAQFVAFGEPARPEAIEFGALFAPVRVVFARRVDHAAIVQRGEKFRVGLQQLQLDLVGCALHRLLRLRVAGMRAQPVGERGKLDAFQSRLAVVIECPLGHARVAGLQYKEDEAIGQDQRGRDQREIRAAKASMQRHDQQAQPPVARMLSIVYLLRSHLSHAHGSGIKQ